MFRLRTDHIYNGGFMLVKTNLQPVDQYMSSTYSDNNYVTGLGIYYTVTFHCYLSYTIQLSCASGSI